MSSSSSAPPSLPKLLKKDPLDTAVAKWVKLWRITYLDQEGKERIWESAERTTRHGDVDGVGILALLHPSTWGTSDSAATHTILLTQFRPPIGLETVELPAGLVDEGESPEEAAVRELREETGYVGTVKTASPVMFSDPGLTNANMKLVIVNIDTSDPQNHNPTRHNIQDGEFIQTHVVPVRGLVGTLCDFQKRGFAVDARLMHLAYGLELVQSGVVV